MTKSEITELRTFEADVRQLIKSYKALQSELSDARRQLSERDEKIERLESDLRIARRSYSTLKVARMIEVSDSDLKESKSRITRLVREVNKCISLLSSEIDDTDSSEASADAKSEETLEILPIDLSIDDKEADTEEVVKEEAAAEEPVKEEAAEEETVEEETVEEEAAVEEPVEDEAAEEETVEEETAVEEPVKEAKAEVKDPWDLNSLPLFANEP